MEKKTEPISFQFLIRTWPVRFNLYDSAMEVKGGESVRINDRQQQIINLLCQRRSDTVQNLAAELGVCERTIRRDIEELTLTYPLETVRGRYGGGVKMADWYFQDRPKAISQADRPAQAIGGWTAWRGPG